jgi:CRP/FNR family cyclic AMP-dependent transcriptional regulator
VSGGAHFAPERAKTAPQAEREERCEVTDERQGQRFPAGTVLFREGDVSNEMYVVHSGKVELTRTVRDRHLHLLYVPPGEFFGEMAILNNRPRSATATVIEDAWLLVISPRTFEQMIRTRAEVAIRIIRSLAARLELANQQIELLLLRDADHRVVHCLRQLSAYGMPADGGGVTIPLTRAQLAGRVALDEEHLDEILGRLAEARLLVRTPGGVVVPEVGRLVDFLEFLEMRERFRAG